MPYLSPLGQPILTASGQAAIDQYRMVSDLYGWGISEDAILSAQERGVGALEQLWNQERIRHSSGFTPQPAAPGSQPGFQPFDFFTQALQALGPHQQQQTNYTPFIVGGLALAGIAAVWFMTR